MSKDKRSVSKRFEGKDYIDTGTLDKRDFLKNVVMKDSLIFVSRAFLSQFIPFKDFLIPEKRFQGDWKGVFPILDLETGFIEYAKDGRERIITKGDIDKMATPDGVTTFTFLWAYVEFEDGNLISGLIARVEIEGEEQNLATSVVCTHERCSAEWFNKEKCWICWCHISKFDPKDGKVLAGPPPRPLQHFKVELTDQLLIPSSLAKLTMIPTP